MQKLSLCICIISGLCRVKINMSSYVYLSVLGALVGSTDRASSQQLEMWFSEHFFAT